MFSSNFRYCVFKTRQEKYQNLIVSYEFCHEDLFQSTNRIINYLSGVKISSKKLHSDNIARIIIDSLSPKMKLNHVVQKVKRPLQRMIGSLEKWYEKVADEW